MIPQKIALLTDSCADLSPRLAEENHIYRVPLRILCTDGEYSDGVDIFGETSTTASAPASCRRPPCPPVRTSKRPCARSSWTGTTASSP